MTSSKQRRLGVAGLGVSFALVLSGCAGFGNLGNEPGVTTLTVARGHNPQTQDTTARPGGRCPPYTTRRCRT
jgi:sorbitol/mannitol transport system substrate-binding protein